MNQRRNNACAWWHMGWVAMLLFSTAHAAESEILSQETTSWDGKALSYPEGQAELSIVRIALAPGDALDFHCHPVPSAAYVLEGDLEVALKDGAKKTFRTGDTITEVTGRLHRGTNLSEDEPVALIAFYAGADDVPLTLHGPESARDCAE